MKLHAILCAAVTGAALTATVVSAGEPARLYVTIDKAEVVNFPLAPFNKVAVTNPNIADVHVLTPTQLLLNGRVTGTTSLLVFYPGRVEYFDVVVHPGPMGNSRARLVPAPLRRRASLLSVSRHLSDRKTDRGREERRLPGP